ncbi:MAG: chorismate mutase [Pyrinomonadaceae bacterium]
MELERKRKEIDELDDSIVRLLQQRVAVAREISILKLSSGLPIVDAHRENDVLRRVSDDAAHGEAIAAIYRAILNESRRIQAAAQAEIMDRGVKL